MLVVLGVQRIALEIEEDVAGVRGRNGIERASVDDLEGRPAWSGRSAARSVSTCALA